MCGEYDVLEARECTCCLEGRHIGAGGLALLKQIAAFLQRKQLAKKLAKKREFLG